MEILAKECHMGRTCFRLAFFRCWPPPCRRSVPGNGSRFRRLERGSRQYFKDATARIRAI